MLPEMTPEFKKERCVTKWQSILHVCLRNFEVASSDENIKIIIFIIK